MPGQFIEANPHGEEKQVTETATFVCSICAEPSEKICAYCTKDTCSNHFCIRCKRCSDCCECEVPLVEERPHVTVAEPQPVIAEAPKTVLQEAVAIAEPAQQSQEPTVEPAPTTEPEDGQTPFLPDVTNS